MPVKMSLQGGGSVSYMTVYDKLTELSEQIRLQEKSGLELPHINSACIDLMRAIITGSGKMEGKTNKLPSELTADIEKLIEQGLSGYTSKEGMLVSSTNPSEQHSLPSSFQPETVKFKGSDQTKESYKKAFKMAVNEILVGVELCHSKEDIKGYLGEETASAQRLTRKGAVRGGHPVKGGAPIKKDKGHPTAANDTAPSAQ